MIQQVMNTTLLISFFLSLVYFVGKTWMDTSYIEKHALKSYYLAQTKLAIPFGRDWEKTQNIYNNRGQEVRVRCVDIVNDPYMVRLVNHFEHQLLQNLFYTGLIFGGFVIFICFIWYYRGRILNKKDVISGSSLVNAKELANLIKKQKVNSDITLGDVPLIKGSEVQHILLVGTIGSGKTNTFNHILPHIRRRNERAIIIDTTGEFVAKYYNPETDHILNPLDARTQSWDMWGECSNSIQMEELAAGMIPHSLSDPFWTDASRSLFVETMKKISQTDSPTKIKDFLSYSTILPLSKVQDFYEGTSVSALMHSSSEKTASSVRMNLATYLRSLNYLEESDTPFSVRQWVRDENQKGWLFLFSLPDQRETLRPLLTTWLNIAINGLMSCVPDFNRRVWFIIDEKQSLNKVEALPKALAEIRKYGGCIVSGLQNISQIDQLYGNAISRSMVSLYNTKLFFRSPESNTAQWIAKTIGENEVLEHNEGISFGAHQMRDGVSINEQRRQKSIVPYTDLMTLPDLSAYLKLSGEYPITKLTFTYMDLPRIAPSFIEREKGTMDHFPQGDEAEASIQLEQENHEEKVSDSSLYTAV
jgi:type IV conjugative transfer system coupling protein TraD